MPDTFIISRIDWNGPCLVRYSTMAEARVGPMPGSESNWLSVAVLMFTSEKAEEGGGLPAEAEAAPAETSAAAVCAGLGAALPAGEAAFGEGEEARAV